MVVYCAHHVYAYYVTPMQCVLVCQRCCAGSGLRRFLPSTTQPLPFSNIEQPHVQHPVPTPFADGLRQQNLHGPNTPLSPASYQQQPTLQASLPTLYSNPETQLTRDVASEMPDQPQRERGVRGVPAVDSQFIRNLKDEINALEGDEECAAQWTAEHARELRGFERSQDRHARGITLMRLSQQVDVEVSLHTGQIWARKGLEIQKALELARRKLATILDAMM